MARGVSEAHQWTALLAKMTNMVTMTIPTRTAMVLTKMVMTLRND